MGYIGYGKGRVGNTGRGREANRDTGWRGRGGRKIQKKEQNEIYGGKEGEERGGNSRRQAGNKEV